MKQKIKIKRDQIEQALDNLFMSRFPNFAYIHKSNANGNEPTVARFPDSIEVEVEVPEVAYDEQQKEITRLRGEIKTANDALNSVEAERYRDATTIDVRDILYSYSAYTIARKALAGES